PAIDLNRFRSKRSALLSGVSTLPLQMSVHGIAQAKDFVRLHPSDDYWSGEMCFVNVPTPGARDTKHLIEEDIALAHLPIQRVEYKRLALASKPGDQFFLCEIPVRNLDNAYNRDAVAACERARRLWAMAVSLRDTKQDGGYEVKLAAD